MPLRKGALSYARFITTGDIPEAFEEPWAEALAAHSFRDIDVDTEELVSAGWVRPGDPFGDKWQPHELVRPGAIMLLCLRIDTLRLPAVTRRAYVEQAIKVRAASMNREKLTRAERKMVEVETVRRLKRQSLPAMTLIDAAWNLGTGELRVMSTSRKPLSLFVDLFEKTFALQLTILGPRNLLWVRGLTEEELDRLSMAEAAPFHLLAGGEEAR